MQLTDPNESNRRIIAKPLREQIYEYLRDEINRGNLRPGALINVNEISQKLGISKTPLRDALIQLECDGFVSILPRRGVVINKLTLNDVKNAWEICRILESEIVSSVFDKIDAAAIEEMERLNGEMKEVSQLKDTYRYYLLNIAFHDVFMNFSDNLPMRKIVTLNKQRLYDFLNRVYIAEWETRNCEEHAAFIELIRRGDRQEAAKFMKDVHWSFENQEYFIRQFYIDEKE